MQICTRTRCHLTSGSDEESSFASLTVRRQSGRIEEATDCRVSSEERERESSRMANQRHCLLTLGFQLIAPAQQG